MTTLLDPNVGKLTIPQFDRVVFLPGMSTGRKPGHEAVVSYTHRDRSGMAIDRNWAAAVVAEDGLRERWYQREDLQQLYRTPELFLASFRERLLTASRVRRAWVPNERVDNGGKMAQKLLFNVSTPDHAATYPTRIALCNLNGFSAAHGDLSIGSATHDVTTNEYTNNHGLNRTGALTPTNGDPSTLDGQYTVTIQNTFTETTGPDTVYGAALFDAAVGTSNMFAEASFTSATLQTNDTLQVTWTCKG